MLNIPEIPLISLIQPRIELTVLEMILPSLVSVNIAANETSGPIKDCILFTVQSSEETLATLRLKVVADPRN
jgi:hypothetical protein